MKLIFLILVIYLVGSPQGEAANSTVAVTVVTTNTTTSKATKESGGIKKVVNTTVVAAADTTTNFLNNTKSAVNLSGNQTVPKIAKNPIGAVNTVGNVTTAVQRVDAVKNEVKDTVAKTVNTNSVGKAIPAVTSNLASRALPVETGAVSNLLGVGGGGGGLLGGQ